jgi:hypothetical protein
MKHLLSIAVGFFLVCPLPLLAQPGPTGPIKEKRPAAAAEAASREIMADLREARELLKNVYEKRTRERIELLLLKAELRLGEMQKNLAALAVSVAPQPVAQADLDSLLKALRKEAFDNTKVPFITDIARTRYFTSAQARELLKTFSFDDGRGQAAVILYPRLTDPGNFYVALEAFTFDAGRNVVREKLKLR